MTDTFFAHRPADESLDIAADIEACTELTLEEETELEQDLCQFRDDFASTILTESVPDAGRAPTQIRRTNWNPRAVGEMHKIAILQLIARVGFATRSLCATLLHGVDYSDSQRRATNDGLDAYVRNGLLLTVYVAGRLAGYGLSQKGAALLNEIGFKDATGHRAQAHANGRTIKVGREWQHDLFTAHVLAWFLHLGLDVVFDRELKRLLGFRRNERIPDGLVKCGDTWAMVFAEVSRKTGRKAEPGAAFLARAIEDGVRVANRPVSRAFLLCVRSAGVNHELRQGRIGRYLTEDSAIPAIICDVQESWRPRFMRATTIHVPARTAWDQLVEISDRGLMLREREWLREQRSVLFNHRAHFAGYVMHRADGATLFGSMRIESDGTISATVTAPRHLWHGWKPIGHLDSEMMSCAADVFGRYAQAIVWDALRQTHQW